MKKEKRDHDKSPISQAKDFLDKAAEAHTNNDYTKKIEHLRSAKSIFKEKNMEVEVGSCNYHIAMALSNLGGSSPKESLNLYDKARKNFEKNNFSLIVAECMGSMSNIYGRLGQHQKAIEFSKKSEKIFEKRDMPVNVAKLKMNRAIIHQERGEKDKALELLKESRKVFQDNQIPVEIGGCNINLGSVYKDMSKHEKAIKCFDKSLENFLKTESHNEVLKVYDQLVEISVMNDNIDAALDYSNKKIEFMSRNDFLERESQFKKAGELLLKGENSKKVTEILIENGLSNQKADNIVKKIKYWYELFSRKEKKDNIVSDTVRRLIEKEPPVVRKELIELGLEESAAGRLINFLSFIMSELSRGTDSDDVVKKLSDRGFDKKATEEEVELVKKTLNKVVIENIFRDIMEGLQEDKEPDEIIDLVREKGLEKEVVEMHFDLVQDMLRQLRDGRGPEEIIKYLKEKGFDESLAKDNVNLFFKVLEESDLKSKVE